MPSAAIAVVPVIGWFALRSAAALPLLEVGHELAAAGVDAEEVVDVGGRRLAFGRPFVISGIALAIPPVPVLVPTPAPVRLNHSSTVNVALRRSLVRRASRTGSNR